MGVDGKIPNPNDLDKELANMVRGWRPEVEGYLRESGQENRAAILAQRYADCFPSTYQSTYGAREAAIDILRLFSLERGGLKSTRLYHLDSDADHLLRLKVYQGHCHYLMPFRRWKTLVFRSWRRFRHHSTMDAWAIFTISCSSYAARINVMR